MRKIYDFIVIGAGISACTFASTLYNRFSDPSILLIEHGRRIGGRSTTRKSRKHLGLEFDHGLPSIILSKDISKDLFKIISPLIKSKKLIDITDDILMINHLGEINYVTSNQYFYRSSPFMINFCEEIIKQSIHLKKINFLFQTLIKKIIYKKDLWEVYINNEMYVRSQNLIISSSLLAHPRCYDILNINYLPLRDAFVEGQDEIVDSLIRQTSQQEYIKRKNYILYVSNSQIVKEFNHQYLQILFSKVIKDNCNFEKIIFHRHLDGSMIIVLHCSYINKISDFNIDYLIDTLKMIFIKHKKYRDLFKHVELIDKINWRASQPINNLVPKELQWSSKSKIGFCGDWFDLDCCVGVESAMNSSIRLANIVSWK